MITEGQLVMVRLETRFGYSNTWWRVMFVDNDGTFVGKLERKDRYEYEAHEIGQTETFPCASVQGVYKDGQEFCYSDNVTICTCPGLCREK